VALSRGATLFCILGAVLLFVLPPVDSPDTVFNEMDTPVTVSHPVLPQLKLTPPAREGRRVPGKLERPEETPVAGIAIALEQQKQPYYPGDLQKLLCTFLI